MINNWYITDYKWFNQDIINSVLDTKSEFSDLDLENDLFYKNLTFLHKNNATIVRDSVDAFNINDDLIENVSIILWGSPHWTQSNNFETEATKHDDVNPQLNYYTTHYKEGCSFPIINQNYDLNFTKHYTTKKYDNHREFKGGVMHFLLNKYPDKIIVISFCDEIDSLFYSGYDDITKSPYAGELYYIYIDVGSYSPSNSEGLTERCENNKVGSLLYIPERYLNTMFKKLYIYDGEYNSKRFRLFDLIRNETTNNEGVLFLGEHVCNFSLNALQHILS